MKLTIDPRSLAEAAAWAARAIPLRPAVPILSGILLEAGEGKLTVSVFDYDTSVAWTLDCDVAEPGRVVLPGRVLAEVARGLPGESFAELALSDGEVALTCGRAAFNLLTLPEGDYPALPVSPPVCGRIEADLLREAVEQVAPAASKDDSLPVLACIHIDVEGEQFTLAATDRYRIAVRDLTWTLLGQPPAGVNVPAQHLVDLVKGGLTGLVDIGWNDNSIGFVCGGRTVTARLLDDHRFIDYRARITAETQSHPIQARVDTADLIAAVKRVTLLAEKNTAVRLGVEAGSVLVQAGGGGGRGADLVACNLDGDPVEIKFLPPFLLDALSGVRAQTVRILLQDPPRTALFTGDRDDSSEGDPFSCLLMALRVDV